MSTAAPLRPERPLTVSQVAHRLGCAPKTVLRALRKNRFPGAFQLERAWRIPVADVVAFQRRAGA